MKIEGKTMNEWVASQMGKHKKTFWGTEHDLDPVISSTILGDGKQLIYLGTINQRPHYWLMKIDSNTDVFSDDFYIDEILEIFEEEFGVVPEDLVDKEEFTEYKKGPEIFLSCLNDYETFEEYDLACQYPALSWDGGHWGSLVNFK